MTRIAHREAARLAGAADERARRQDIGVLSGILFSAGALVSLPSALALDPRPPAWVFAVLALGLAVGVTCLLLDWRELAPASLHALPLTGIVLIGAVDMGTEPRGHFYAWLYVLVAVMVAYTFRRRAVIAAYLALMALGSALPLLDPDTNRADLLRDLLVSVPSLVIVTALVAHFREHLEARRDAYVRLARLDPLTGVGNYRALHERLDYEIARHERHGRRLAVMLLDLNRFKGVNETYGHLEGDRVLREIGTVLSGTVRDQDTVARQGGDEFSVLAPETSTVEVMALASRIAEALATIPVGGASLSASIGWAIFPEDGSTAEELLLRADNALREGKARWLPEERREYWPEHLRRLRDAPGQLPGAGSARTAS